MKISELINGLSILKPYYKGEDGYHLGAEHDVLYAYATDMPLSKEDVQKMHENGWFQEIEPDWEPEHYDSTEKWVAYP